MADEFDAFLAHALSPEPRPADRGFIARVNARVALDRRLRAERSAMFRRVGREALALAAIAGGLLWLGRAAPIADFAAESPGAMLALLLSAFAFFVLVFSRDTDEQSLAQVDFQPISNS